MADQNDTAPAAEAETPAPWIGTLRKGLRYVFRGKHYKRDEDFPADDELKAALQKRAVDIAVIEGEEDEDGNQLTEARPKFAFRPAGQAAPAGRRRRAPAA